MTRLPLYHLSGDPDHPSMQSMLLPPILAKAPELDCLASVALAQATGGYLSPPPSPASSFSGSDGSSHGTILPLRQSPSSNRVQIPSLRDLNLLQQYPQAPPSPASTIYSYTSQATGQYPYHATSLRSPASPTTIATSSWSRQSSVAHSAYVSAVCNSLSPALSSLNIADTDALDIKISPAVKRSRTTKKQPPQAPQRRPVHSKAQATMVGKVAGCRRVPKKELGYGHCNKKYTIEQVCFIIYASVDLELSWDDTLAWYKQIVHILKPNMSPKEYGIEQRRTKNGPNALFYRYNERIPTIDANGGLDIKKVPYFDSEGVVLGHRFMERTEKELLRIKRAYSTRSLLLRYPERILEGWAVMSQYLQEHHLKMWHAEATRLVAIRAEQRRAYGCMPWSPDNELERVHHCYDYSDEKKAKDKKAEERKQEQKQKQKQKLKKCVVNQRSKL